MSLLILLLSLGLALWLAAVVWNLYNSSGVVTLSASAEFPLQDEPRVSIIIPARNEAVILAESLPRFLAQEYSNYEVIVIDDASTDESPSLLKDYLARYPDRLRVCRVEELPAGWVGKSYALHTGFQAARGEWILASDADILFHPKALRAGLWAARERRADLVSIFAYLEYGSFWEKLMMPGFSLMLATFFPFRKINDPNSSVAVASGGYILMKRALWESLGGYRLIRSEMIDDLNTARIVKHSGHKLFAAITKDLLSTRMYESFSELWEGLRKNAFAGNRYSGKRMTIGLCGMFITNVLPIAILLWALAMLLAGRPLCANEQTLIAISSLEYALAVLLQVPIFRYHGVGLGYALLAPFGTLLYACISLDSMLRTLFGGGVSWKLRQYGKPPAEARR